MDRPVGQYVALYGSNSGNWREPIKLKLREQGIQFFDPITPEWNDINEENGDEKQELIDQLVSREYDALEHASCVIVHIAYQKKQDGKPTGETTYSIASRNEMNFLAGLSLSESHKTVFVVVDKDVPGRNHLWAVCKKYNLVRVETLEEATNRAIQHMNRTYLARFY